MESLCEISVTDIVRDAQLVRSTLTHDIVSISRTSEARTLHYTDSWEQVAVSSHPYSRDLSTMAKAGNGSS